MAPVCFSGRLSQSPSNCPYITDLELRVIAVGIDPLHFHAAISRTDLLTPWHLALAFDAGDGLELDHLVTRDGPDGIPFRFVSHFVSPGYRGEKGPWPVEEGTAHGEDNTRGGRSTDTCPRCALVRPPATGAHPRGIGGSAPALYCLSRGHSPFRPLSPNSQSLAALSMHA